MKNTLLIFLMLITLYSCNSTYETTVSGMDNTAAIKILKSNKASTNYRDALQLIIDGEKYKIAKIYPETKSLKAPIYTTTPGKHLVIIKDANHVILYKKELFIDNRETRIIILN